MRGSIRELTAEATDAEQEGGVERLQVLINRLYLLEEEEEEISWGDVEDPRSPGVELPYDALDYDDRTINTITSKPTSTPMEVGWLASSSQEIAARPPTSTSSVVGGRATSTSTAGTYGGPSIEEIHEYDSSRKELRLGNEFLNLFFLCNAKICQDEVCGIYLPAKL